MPELASSRDHPVTDVKLMAFNYALHIILAKVVICSLLQFLVLDLMDQTEFKLFALPELLELLAA